MKWIKASERQPEDWSKVLVREIGQPRSFSPKYKLSHRGDLLILDAIGHPIKDVPLKFVEWLDESDDDLIEIKPPELKQVWFDKKSNGKFMVRSQHQIEAILRNPRRYVFVSPTPHAETNNKYGGVFSYTCDSDWCRCKQ